MKIRILTEADAKTYQAVRLSALITNPEAFSSTYEREAAFSIETVKERISPSSDKFVLGAFDKKETLVGLVTFFREIGLKINHKANVFGMYVVPEARGKGVAKQLMQELIKKAKECQGVEQLLLTVVQGNASAKRLYESLGFEVYGLERNALKVDGEYLDEDWMVLFLS
ncbi:MULTISPECIES: GNAT family N-acetyltransferase [Bacillus]|uniref:GNAT family N-acetyltransferase n=1 Tax=Bacillus TaxID=1386 RepID=UPI000BB7AE5E|nr:MULTISPECIES: GNAT family N-acetyltransferase [Bacillus]